MQTLPLVTDVRNEYEVVDFRRVARPILKAYVVFRQRFGQRTERCELRVDSVRPWLEVPGEVTPWDVRHKPEKQRIHVGIEYFKKQYALNLAVCRYLALPHADAYDVFERLRDFLISTDFKKWEAGR
jgi:hypothetical protein